MTAYAPMVGWTLMLASLALTIIFGMVLAFHWIRYAMNRAATTVAFFMYAGVSAFLLMGMATALAVYLYGA